MDPKDLVDYKDFGHLSMKTIMTLELFRVNEQ